MLTSHMIGNRVLDPKNDHLCSREPKSLTQTTIMINQTIGQWNYVSQYTHMIFNITYDHISSYYHWFLLFLLELWLFLWLLPLLLLLHNHIVFLCIYRMSFGMWCWKVCNFFFPPARMTSDVQLGFVVVVGILHLLNKEVRLWQPAESTWKYYVLHSQWNKDLWTVLFGLREYCLLADCFSLLSACMPVEK